MMDTVEPILAEGIKVKVAVVLDETAEGAESVFIHEDGGGLDYKSGREEQTKSFTFDRVVSVENMQSLQLSLLLPLIESISAGYNGTLLVCGDLEQKVHALIDEHIIKQVLSNLFSHIAHEKEEVFISASFLQFQPDGSAVDFLSPDRTTLNLIAHLVPGGIIRGLREVCVSSADGAYSVHEMCRKRLKANETFISSRCSSLFTVTVEQKLRPESGEESRVCRSKLQLFSLCGGASRSDLRGVNPLAKVVDGCEALNNNNLLSLLLTGALNENSTTVLLCYIRPQGLLDDETPSALALAHKVRSCVSWPVIGHWCPKTTEKNVRDEITEVRTKMMSQRTDSNGCTLRLTELIRNLQIVKDQSWERRRDISDKMKKKLEFSQSLNGTWQPSGNINPPLTDSRRITEDQLRQEMEEHVKECRGNVEERVKRIQLLKEALVEKTAAEKGEICQHVEHHNAQERRRQLREAHEKCIQEEVEKMKGDLAREQLPMEGPERELLVLTRERKILLLQMEVLRAEVQQAETDLEREDNKHQVELHCLRSESLQVFRVFRQVSEELRKMSEGRYRSVLLEAVQDAVYLSAQNQQLQADNKQLCKALLEAKDMLAARADLSTGASKQ